jgi:hypothetical protein
MMWHAAKNSGKPESLRFIPNLSDFQSLEEKPGCRNRVGANWVNDHRATN